MAKKSKSNCFLCVKQYFIDLKHSFTRPNPMLFVS